MNASARNHSLSGYVASARNNSLSGYVAIECG